MCFLWRPRDQSEAWDRRRMGPFRTVLCSGLRHVAFGRFGIVLGQFVTDHCDRGRGLRLESETLAQVVRQGGSMTVVFFCGI